MKSENKTLNEIMQKLRIEFLNYFRTHIYEIFIFVILLFLIYYVNCIFYFYYFYYAKMQKYVGHNKLRNKIHTMMKKYIKKLKHTHTHARTHDH